MKFTEKYNSQTLSKIILLVISIPIVIVILFFAWAIIIPIACVLFIIMYFAGKKFNRNAFFFKINKNPFDKNKQTNSKKPEDSEYYDAEYISIDDKDEKK